jgi:DNA repair protein RecN (Recombination protein N)
MAARAMTQYRITKTVRRGRTVTSVDRLTASARVDEIARMIAGDAASDAVRASASEMLAAGRGSQGSAAEAKGESESPTRGESRTRRSRN